MSEITRKELDELKRKALLFDQEHPPKKGEDSSQEADTYAMARQNRTDLQVQRELNIGLKDIYNAFLKYAPDARLLGQEFIDYMVEHKFKLYGAYKATHAKPLPLTTIGILVVILVGIFALSQNADGIDTYLSKGSNQGFILIILIVIAVIAYIVYRRRQ